MSTRTQPPAGAGPDALAGSPTARRLVRDARSGAITRLDVIGPGGHGKTVLLDALAAAFAEAGVPVRRDIPADALGKAALLVDDAHLLDEGSAALVLLLVSTGPTRVVATVRSGAPCPDAVVALWKEGLAELVELAPLGRSDTLSLAARALGARPGSLFDHRTRTTGRWADIFDGIVVFRTERPPVRIDE